MIAKLKMGRMKMQMEKKYRVLILKKGDSVIAVARDIGISKEAKKIGGVIFTRDGTKEKVRLWHT